MLLTQINCLQNKESMSKGPDILSMIHFCQSRGVYHATGPLALLRVFMTQSNNGEISELDFRFLTFL